MFSNERPIFSIRNGLELEDEITVKSDLTTFKMLQTANSAILKHLTEQIQSNKLTWPSQILDVNIVAISISSTFSFLLLIFLIIKLH